MHDEHPVLSIIIPCYNEEQRINATLQNIDSYLRTRPWTYEIIVVNDGSTDRTEQSVQQHRGAIPQLHLITNDVNRGKGAAVKCGMLAARGVYRLFMDADHSVSIQHLEHFLPYLTQGYDVVIGSIEVAGARVHDDCGFWRRILGRLAKMLIRLCILPHIRDSQRGFKLFSKKAAEDIFHRQTIERFGFDIEILYIAQMRGYTIKELPVTWNNQKNPFIGASAYFSTLRELFVIIDNHRRGIY